MKFKFAPKGEYRPQQLITIAGVEYVVIEVAHTGRSLIAKTTAAPITHINVILTDAKPIEEIPAQPGGYSDVQSDGGFDPRDRGSHDLR
jgi:hypothetical protein